MCHLLMPVPLTLSDYACGMSGVFLWIGEAGYTKWGSITILLTSCLTGLESAL
jgi:hypothetical protein